MNSKQQKSVADKRNTKLNKNQNQNQRRIRRKLNAISSSN